MAATKIVRTLIILEDGSRIVPPLRRSDRQWTEYRQERAVKLVTDADTPKGWLNRTGSSRASGPILKFLRELWVVRQLECANAHVRIGYFVVERPSPILYLLPTGRTVAPSSSRRPRLQAVRQQYRYARRAPRTTCRCAACPKQMRAYIFFRNATKSALRTLAPS
jgi:hypothetical protein